MADTWVGDKTPFGDKTGVGARTWVAKTIGLLILAALAVVALLSAVDRLARQVALPPALHPLVLSAGGRAVLAARALEKGDVAAAARLAEDAVRRQPFNQLAVRTLGLARLQRGDAATADVLMRHAGALGWREPATQSYWAQVALQSGDAAVAAQRLDAMMRASAGADTSAADTLRQLEASPAGRDAIAARFGVPAGGAAAWHGRYLSDFNNLPDAALPGRTALVVAGLARGMVIEDTAKVYIQRYLFSRGREGDAYAVWQALRGPALFRDPARSGDPSRIDIGFASADLRADLGPFDWTFGGAPGLDLAIAALPAPLVGQGLHVRMGAMGATDIARRVVMLPAGRWRLDFGMTGAKTDEPLRLVAACANDQTPIDVERAAARARAVAFELIVPSECPAQSLRLLIPSEEARRSADFWIGKAILRPAV